MMDFMRHHEIGATGAFFQAAVGTCLQEGGLTFTVRCNVFVDDGGLDGR